MAYHAFSELFTLFHYPAGEGHVRLARPMLPRTDGDANLTIEAPVRDFASLCHVVTADRILARNGIGRSWFLPYFPFARHDRRNDAQDGFELELALELVKPLRVTVADPHSNVAAQLRHLPQSCSVDRFRAHGAFDDHPVVIIPDAGAAKKVLSWVREGEAPVQCLKHRDPATGKLSAFQVLQEDFGGRPCIIVDDICDGGGTFLGLAAELRKKGAGPLSLAVTHGLFTKGVDVLLESFASIYTFVFEAGEGIAAPPPPSHARLHTIPFRELFEKGAAR